MMNQKDFVVCQEKHSENFKAVVRGTVIGDNETATSRTFVQYGKGSDNKDCIRFATAVKGNISNLTYNVAYKGLEEQYEVGTVYQAISVEGQPTYFNGEALSTDENDKGKYYWACITFKFNSEKEVNTQFTASLNIVDSNEVSINSDAKTTTLGNLKHEGYSIVNQTNNNTQITKGDGTVTITNDGSFDWSPQSRNIVLANDLTYSGDVTLSVDMSVQNVDYPIAGLHNQGLVFYYVDDANYLIAYTNYSYEKANLMREVQISGVLNGQALPWGDFWTEEWDGFTSDFIKPSKFNTLTIVKSGSKIYPYLNGISLRMWYGSELKNYYDLSGYDISKESKVGYHVDSFPDSTNTVTFSDIKLQTADEQLYSPYSWSNQKGYENVWTVNEEAKSIVSTNNSWMSNFFISNSLSSKMDSADDATVSLNIKGTMGFPNTREARVGLIPWYVDENNFVVLFLQWSPTDRNTELHQIQMTGRINGNTLPVWDNGWVNREWNDMWANGTEIAANDDITLSVTKKITNGDSIRFTITVSNSKGVSRTFEHGFGILNTGSLLPEGKMGLFAQGDTFTFTNISKTLLN